MRLILNIFVKVILIYGLNLKVVKYRIVSFFLVRNNLLLTFFIAIIFFVH